MTAAQRLAGPSEHVVAVIAHPDDAELLCYGTLRQARLAGAAATVVVVTHGANGVSVADADAGRRLDEDDRAAEVRAAWAGTGVDTVFLGLPDGALAPDRDLISAVERELAARRCTVLITHSLRAANDHQDHLAVGTAAANAATRVPSCHTVLHGEPHAPRSGFTPTVLVDITSFLDDKVLALKAHQSQAGRWYLGEEYTRHQAAQAAWRLRPTAATDGRVFETFETSVLTLTFTPAGKEPRS
ncbi:PIG-L deacetylase family protein [Streptomyces sp. NPDC088745]|uniref:PIG-L deacetylase family protein n=1 Tax=Streptomyces sp. NPDC088745 TaxID=3365884 RepID=UPI00380F7DA6